MKILVLDNYDSFTYNLVQLIKANSDADVAVFRNDEITIEAVNDYDKIILSPGPGIPVEAGILCELIAAYKATKSIFGVCLGMQAIGEVYGATLVNIAAPLHGVATPIHHTGSKLFEDIPATFSVGRYHSWVVSKETVPAELRITAQDLDGFVMALEHTQDHVSGVQFHPESILTEYGKEIMINFLNQPI